MSNLEKPSRRKKRSLPIVVPTRWSPELLAGVAEGERKALRPLFDGGVEGAIRAAAAASERAADLERAALVKEPPPAPIACRAGCPSCCVSKVAVVAPELFRILAYLREALSADALQALVARVRATDEVTRGLSRVERARASVPCPLLAGGS